MRSVPPGFWASAGKLPRPIAANAKATANLAPERISCSLRLRSPPNRGAQGNCSLFIHARRGSQFEQALRWFKGCVRPPTACNHNPDRHTRAFVSAHTRGVIRAPLVQSGRSRGLRPSTAAPPPVGRRAYPRHDPRDDAGHDPKDDRPEDDPRHGQYMLTHAKFRLRIAQAGWELVWRLWAALGLGVGLGASIRWYGPTRLYARSSLRNGRHLSNRVPRHRGSADVRVGRAACLTASQRGATTC